MVTKTYSYNDKEFIFSTEITDLSAKSKFDECLCKTWDKTMQDGTFWYNLNQVQYKEIPGKFKFVAQLNTQRHAQRRKPQCATHVCMPFDANKFNFNKIKEEEILLELERVNEEHKSSNEIIINVSPIDYCHVLLVPNRKACLPQVLDENAIKAASEMCLLSNTRALCIGFNSLCALASVNHQHLHASYFDWEVPVDRCLVTNLQANIYRFDDYTVNGFVIPLENDVVLFTRSVANITTWLSQQNIAHNLVIRRRKWCEEGMHVTAYIFPKKVCSGVKDALHLSSCCFDLAGYLLLKDGEEYNQLTENEALSILRLYTYNDNEFHELWQRMRKEVVVTS